jgi:hypothetical protein
MISFVQWTLMTVQLQFNATAYAAIKFDDQFLKRFRFGNQPSIRDTICEPECVPLLFEIRLVVAASVKDANYFRAKL